MMIATVVWVRGNCEYGRTFVMIMLELDDQELRNVWRWMNKTVAVFVTT